jgi:hypothetical protein
MAGAKQDKIMGQDRLNVVIKRQSSLLDVLGCFYALRQHPMGMGELLVLYRNFFVEPL